MALSGDFPVPYGSSDMDGWMAHFTCLSEVEEMKGRIGTLDRFPPAERSMGRQTAEGETGDETCVWSIGLCRNVGPGSEQKMTDALLSTQLV